MTKTETVKLILQLMSIVYSAFFSAVFALILLGAEVKLVEPNSAIAVTELAFCVAFLVVGAVISFRDLRGKSQ